MSGRSIEGFEIPLHRALTEPILLGGAPRSVAILNVRDGDVIGLPSSGLKVTVTTWSARASRLSIVAV